MFFTVIMRTHKTTEINISEEMMTIFLMEVMESLKSTFQKISITIRMKLMTTLRMRSRERISWKTWSKTTKETSS